jgi:hypothetical protein
VNECLLKTLLHHILGVLVGVGERHRAEQHYRPVALNQQFERFRVAALGAAATSEASLGTAPRDLVVAIVAFTCAPPASSLAHFRGLTTQSYSDFSTG